MRSISDTPSERNGHALAEKSFHANFEYYESRHRTVGCKVTHMFGIPMIAVSFLVLPFSRKAFAQLQFWGWILQLVGHIVFEHNRPVLLEVRSPYTAISALVFVYKEWQRALERRSL